MFLSFIHKNIGSYVQYFKLSLFCLKRLIFQSNMFNIFQILPVIKLISQSFGEMLINNRYKLAEIVTKVFKDDIQMLKLNSSFKTGVFQWKLIRFTICLISSCLYGGRWSKVFFTIPNKLDF